MQYIEFMSNTTEKEESIHLRLSRLRREKKLTAKVMARLIGVPESTYREWEYGRGMRLPPFKKISQVLAISVTELITGQQPSQVAVTEALELVEQRLREIRSNLSSLI